MGRRVDAVRADDRAALPPIVTVGSRPMSSGDEKAIGDGDGWGAPDDGLGTWCAAHLPSILSPMTSGLPLVRPLS